jgi:hypothetical protein
VIFAVPFVALPLGIPNHERDGFQMGFNSPRFIADPFDRELAVFEGMCRTGQQIAAAAALEFCAEHKLQTPQWVLESASTLLCDLLRREKSEKRGRSCGHVARHRQDRIDYDRWCAVTEIREKQTELKNYVRELHTRQGIPKAYLEDRENHLEWVGNSLERAFECASLLLGRTDSCGSPDAVKRSYLNVEANNRSGEQFCRYHLLDYRFLVKIGITTKVGVTSPAATGPIYELTLDR